MEKKNCSVSDSLGVSVTCPAGSWPDEGFLAEIHLNTPVKEVLEKAAKALNISSIENFEAQVSQHTIDISKSFKELGLNCIVHLVMYKRETGGGAHPLLSQEIFNKEISRLTPHLLNPRGWSLKEINYPKLVIQFSAPEKEDLVVSCDCEDYPSTPPSYSFLNTNNVFLNQISGLQNGFINQSPHPVTSRIFICAPGAREFHTHPSHVNERWENFNNNLNTYGIIAMLDKIYHTWHKGNK